MKILKWESLPAELQVNEIKKYYNILKAKKISLTFKRLFDVFFSIIALLVLSPVFLVIALFIKIDSPGPIFYRQTRVTQYGKTFRMHKFRTMSQNADKGSQITIKNDNRITRVGKLIRNTRLDELPQLIDVLQGNLTFVGVRPEVPKYVAQYTNEMKATLLLPAGVTNLACIYYKDEAEMLDGFDNVDKIYVEQILPGKMYYNLKGIEQFNFWNDIKIMFMTAFAVLGVKYSKEQIEVAPQVISE